MLQLLEKFEAQIVSMLAEEKLWNSVLVNYHKPYVERLWRNWGNNRVYLHKIYPCEREDVLFHPHPWPQAAKVLSGTYEMGLGYGEKNDQEPPIITTLLVKAGTSYEMVDANAWHYVRPINEPSLSIMVSGKPWKIDVSKKKKKMNLPELSETQKTALLKEFRNIYSAVSYKKSRG